MPLANNCVSLRLKQSYTMDKKSITQALMPYLVAIGFVLVFGSCQNQPQTLAGQIDQLKRQITADSTALFQLKTVDFQRLNADFRYCDSMLQYASQDQIETAFEPLNLTQAYLQQFSEVQPIMSQKMHYTLLQIELLKADAESHYLSDSLALVYLNDESRVADTLHNQVEYFKDRFGQCQKKLDQLKKDQK